MPRGTYECDQCGDTVYPDEGYCMPCWETERKAEYQDHWEYLDELDLMEREVAMLLDGVITQNNHDANNHILEQANAHLS